MLQTEQIIDAPIATDDSLSIKDIPDPGFNLGPLALKTDILPLGY